MKRRGRKNNKRVEFFFSSFVGSAESPAFDAISTKAENILRIFLWMLASTYTCDGCWGMRTKRTTCENFIGIKRKTSNNSAHSGQRILAMESKQVFVSPPIDGAPKKPLHGFLNESLFYDSIKR